MVSVRSFSPKCWCISAHLPDRQNKFSTYVIWWGKIVECPSISWSRGEAGVEANVLHNDLSINLLSGAHTQTTALSPGEEHVDQQVSSHSTDEFRFCLFKSSACQRSLWPKNESLYKKTRKILLHTLKTSYLFPHYSKQLECVLCHCLFLFFGINKVLAFL